MPASAFCLGIPRLYIHFLFSFSCRNCHNAALTCLWSSCEMMINARSLKNFTFVLAIFLSMRFFCRAAELSEFLPSQTLAVIEINDCRQFKTELQNTPIGKFYAAPEAADFFQPGRKRLDEILKEVGIANLTVDDLLSKTKGGFCFAALPRQSGSKNQYSWALLMQN